MSQSGVDKSYSLDKAEFGESCAQIFNVQTKKPAQTRTFPASTRNELVLHVTHTHTRARARARTYITHVFLRMRTHKEQARNALHTLTSDNQGCFFQVHGTKAFKYFAVQGQLCMVSVSLKWKTAKG